MKILSSSALFQTCINFFLLLKTVDSHSIFIYFFQWGILVNGVLQLFGYQHSSFMFSGRKKFIQV